MSILERLTRVLEKNDLLPRLIRLLSFLAAIIALVGTGWMFVLPLDGQYRNTYISENALMPSQAYSFYRESEWNFLRGYREELIRMKDQSLHSKNEQIASWLRDIGYKTSIHHFTDLDDGSVGENMHAVLHTPRADSEAMVLSAPWLTSSGEPNIGGISLAISLGKYLSRLNIWSKNIILVFPQDAKFASRKWVEAYHKEADNTGGSIESAIVLEFASEGDHLHHIELEYDGLNGQLPNLDLINCAVYIGEHEGFKIALHKEAQYENNYWNRLKILLLGVKDLAITGIVTNSCETFSGWNIQALTLRGVGDAPIDVTTYGRVVEGLFRSVNNLLEKFHQSFFYYLMLQPRNFVSIGTYLPSTVALSVSYGVASLNSFLNNSFPYAKLITEVRSALTVFTAIFVLSVGGGLMLQAYHGWLLKETSTLIFIQANILLSVLPIVNINRVFGFEKQVRYVLQSWSYLYLTTILVSLLVVHFTLSFAIGVLSIPLLFVKIEYAENSQYRLFKHLTNSVLLLLSNPFTALMALSKFDDIPVYELMTNLLNSWNQLQSWTWLILIIGWYPVWLGILISSL